MARREDYEQVYILKNGKVVADSRELGYYLFTRKTVFSVCFHLHHSAVTEIPGRMRTPRRRPCHR